MKDLTQLNGANVEAGIEVIDGVATTLSGEAIPFMQLLYIRTALQIQARGMRLSRNVPMGTTMARKALGLRGNRERLLEQVNAIIARIQSERGE